MNCRKTNVLPTSCVCGGMRSSRPTGAVQKEFARPRERRGEVTPPYGVPRCYPEHSFKIRKPRYTPPVFWNLQSKFNSLRARSARKKARPKACLLRFRAQVRRNAIPCRIPAVPEQAGQAHRSAPHKIPRKSRGVYLTFTPLPAPYPRAPSLAPSGQFTLRRRGLVRCADERGVSFPVSSEPETYPGGTASPLDTSKKKSLPKQRFFFLRFTW